MVSWWHRDVIAAGKLPLMLCFLAFVVTFVLTRTITRMIRKGRGQFRNHVTASGVHIHHAVPGIILLMVGAFTSIASPDELGWRSFAAVAVGTGVALVGFSPFGVKDADSIEVSLRLTATGVLVLVELLVLICVLKGKYRTALFGFFLAPVALFGAVRLARPTSVWARHRYRGKRMERATRRAADFSRRFGPLQTAWDNFAGGKPSLPNPPPAKPDGGEVHG